MFQLSDSPSSSAFVSLNVSVCPPPSYRLDAAVRDVHQLVALPGHGPDFSPEHDVLHGEQAQVLDLQSEQTNRKVSF